MNCKFVSPQAGNRFGAGIIAVLGIAGAIMVLTGCAGTGKAMTDSASAKNIGLDGYVMMGVVETNNPETATPQGKIVIGRVTYKSRKVGIPADQKVPTTGYFKATKTKSLFGTEEAIIEYDFTAGSDAEAKLALEKLEANRKAVMDAEAEKQQTSTDINRPLPTSTVDAK